MQVNLLHSNVCLVEKKIFYIHFSIFKASSKHFTVYRRIFTVKVVHYVSLDTLNRVYGYYIQVESCLFSINEEELGPRHYSFRVTVHLHKKRYNVSLQRISFVERQSTIITTNIFLSNCYLRTYMNFMLYFNWYNSIQLYTINSNMLAEFCM